MNIDTTRISPEKTGLAGVDDNAPHLLIVDDDRRIRSLLKQYLFEHGYRVSTADSAFSAERTMQGLTYDLLILDVMMPGKDGFQFATELRKTTQVPILMLTARAEPENRINGLEIGVDDYLGKPFEPRELLLRIRNILQNRETSNESSPELFEFAGMAFNLENGELRRGEDFIRLTERERKLLSIFAIKSGRTVSRTDLADAGIALSERAVDVQVNRLRRKIEADPSNPLILQTVRGVGYRLYDS